MNLKLLGLAALTLSFWGLMQLFKLQYYLHAFYYYHHWTDSLSLGLACFMLFISGCMAIWTAIELSFKPKDRESHIALGSLTIAIYGATLISFLFCCWWSCFGRWHYFGIDIPHEYTWHELFWKVSGWIHQWLIPGIGLLWLGFELSKFRSGVLRRSFYASALTYFTPMMLVTFYPLAGSIWLLLTTPFKPIPLCCYIANLRILLLFLSHLLGIYIIFKALKGFPIVRLLSFIGLSLAMYGGSHIYTLSYIHMARSTAEFIWMLMPLLFSFPAILTGAYLIRCRKLW